MICRNPTEILQFESCHTITKIYESSKKLDDRLILDHQSPSYHQNMPFLEISELQRLSMVTKSVSISIISSNLVNQHQGSSENRIFSEKKSKFEISMILMLGICSDFIVFWIYYIVLDLWSYYNINTGLKCQNIHKMDYYSFINKGDGGYSLYFVNRYHIETSNDWLFRMEMQDVYGLEHKGDDEYQYFKGHRSNAASTSSNISCLIGTNCDNLSLHRIYFLWTQNINPTLLKIV